MGFQLPTLQLLPSPERSSYAGAVVEVLEGLDGRLRVRHEGRIIAPQEAPPSPAQHSSARAMEIPRLLLPQPPEPTTWASAGQRPSNLWIQGQRMRRIKRA